MSDTSEATVVPARKAVERISELETLSKQNDEAHKFIMADLSALKEGIRNITEVVQASIKVGGEDLAQKIQEQILANREELRLQRVAQEKDRIVKFVQEGKLAECEIVDDNTLVIGAEYDKTDAPVGLGYVAVEYNNFVPEVKEKLKGQMSGFKLDLPDGKLEVLEVYQILAPADATVEAAEVPEEYTVPVEAPVEAN